MWKRASCLGIFVLGIAAFTAAVGATSEQDKTEGKYNRDTFVPTDDEVIEKMFEMGKITKKDFLFDLGCGDNRICFMAAKKFGCRGVGIETNPVRIREAMNKFEELNKGDALVYSDVKLPLVETRHGDALEAKDIGDATVVVMYMFPDFMTLWFPIAEKKLKPGTRILSHDYEWSYKEQPNAWKPVATEVVKSKRRSDHKVIMWVVPEKAKARGN